MPFSLRLDPDTEERIDRLVKGSGKSRASVVREAVARYAAATDQAGPAYEKLKPFIGVARSGRSDLSQQTGRTFTDLLLKQRAGRARRPR